LKKNTLKKEKEMITENIIGSENYVIEAADLNEKKKTMDIMMIPKEDSMYCPVCERKTSYRKSRRNRVVRDLPIGEYIEVRLHYQTIYYQCSGCRKLYKKELDLVESNQFATKRFKMFIGKMSNIIPPKQVSEEYNLDDNTVYRYEDYFLKKNAAAGKL
jgi:transposase